MKILSLVIEVVKKFSVLSIAMSNKLSYVIFKQYWVNPEREISKAYKSK
jgi:hypothetical protein